jgi:hypothetical protein
MNHIITHKEKKIQHRFFPADESVKINSFFVSFGHKEKSIICTIS